MKANHDTSTIDFAYLPELEDTEAGTLKLRVPLLPTQFFPGNGHGSIEETGEPVSIPSHFHKLLARYDAM